MSGQGHGCPDPGNGQLCQREALDAPASGSSCGWRTRPTYQIQPVVVHVLLIVDLYWGTFFFLFLNIQSGSLKDKTCENVCDCKDELESGRKKSTNFHFLQVTLRVAAAARSNFR